jgi:hypothetical protein
MHVSTARFVTRHSRLMRRGASWLGAAAFVAGTTAFVTPPRLATVPGTIYTFRTTTAESDESFSAARKVVTQSTGKVQIAGDKARIDFSDLKGPSPAMGSKEGYILLHDGGNTMYMVDPKEKQYMKVDAKALGSMMSSLASMTGGIMKIEFKDPSVTVNKLGAGEAILGYDTEKWEILQNYTMSMRVMGMGRTNRVESRTMLWMAPKLAPKDMMNPFTDMARNMSGMFEGFSNFEEVIAAPMRQLPTYGTLKSVSQSKTTQGDRGRPQYELSTMEVTEWTTADVPAAVFELPSNFKLIEMPKMDEAEGNSGGGGLGGLLRRRPPA